MKTLIAEDDRVNATLLARLLEEFGEVHVAEDGMEALDRVRSAVDEKQPYDLICLDILMPKLDGQHVLQAIREEEQQRGVAEDDAAKVIMISALDDSGNILGSFQMGCEVYITKPFEKQKLLEHLKEMDLI